MRVRPFLFVPAVFVCASTTVATAQQASIYGVFCDTPAQVEMYILEQQGSSPEDALDKVSKQDNEYNCRKLHVRAVGIQQVGELRTFLEKTVGVFAVRVVAILPISGGSEPYQRFENPILVYTPISIR